MPDTTAATLAIIRAALEDAHLLNEDPNNTARRVAQYLISSGYQITPETDSPPIAA